MLKHRQQIQPILSPLIISLALGLSANLQNNNLLLQWFSFSLISILMLWCLRQAPTFFALKQDKAFISYLLFILWAVISSLFWSLTHAPSVLSIAVLLGGLFSYLIAYSLSDKQAKVFYQMLLGFGLCLVFYTYYQAFVLDVPRPSGLMPNANGHATFMGMIIMPWVLRYVLKKSVDKLSLCFFSCVTFLFALAIALTVSRGALLFLVFCFMMYLCFSYWHKRYCKMAIYLFSAIVLGYFVSMLLLSTEMSSRLGNEFGLGQGRKVIWDPAWRIFLDHPFIGSGLNSFRFLFVEYREPLTTELGYFAHNDFLQYLAELGIVGFILFVSFIFIILRRLFTVIEDEKETLSDSKIEAFSLLATSVAMLVHTCFTFHLYYLMFQILWGFYLGRAAYLLQADRQLVVVSPDMQKRFLLFFQSFRIILISTLLIFGVAFYYMQQAEQATNESEKIDYQWKAGLLFPVLGFYETTSAKRLLPFLNDASYAPELREQMSLMALGDINIAIDKAGFNPLNYVIKANIFRAMNMEPKKVIAIYEQALRLNPYLLNVRDEYAHYLIEQGNPQQALKILQDGWGRSYASFYKNALVFLRYHLSINQLYGKPSDNLLIETEIKRFILLEKESKGGAYYFGST